MKIPVIILNYNSIENTKKCIASFSKSKFEYFFIVIDNNSNDKDIIKMKLNLKEFKSIEEALKKEDELINDKGIIVKLNKNYGYSYANNIGLKIAKKLKFQYAIVANPDTEIIDIDYYENLINKLDFIAIFPKVVGKYNEVQGLYSDRNPIQILIRNYLSIFYKPFEKIYRKIMLKKSEKNCIIKIQYSIGCFIFFNLKLFEKIGYFDDNVFLYGEEPIIFQRIIKSGRQVYYSSKLKVKHNHYYKEMNQYTKNEHHKSRVYYYRTYKKYNNILINILEHSEKFRENTYDKLYKKIKNIKIKEKNNK